jgi:hypothetical protein
MNFVTPKGDFFKFKCPHCTQELEVHKTETNCCIFRCGIIKQSKTQIPPHTSKPECDRLRNNGLIYGCARPFKFVYSNPNYVEKCEYI